MASAGSTMWTCPSCLTYFLDYDLYLSHACDGFERKGDYIMVSDTKGFITKDSGERQEFSTGMQRDVQKGKARFDLIDKPMLWRWAELMGRGADKYGERNWEKAATEDELNRFKASAERHLQQLLRGDTDEDHAAAVLFNIAGIEHVKTKLHGEK